MKRKILIVEDEYILAAELTMILENAGYPVCGTAESVEEARTMIAREQPQLVLLDIQLKGSLTGIDLAVELSAIDLPFVYLSGNSSEKLMAEAKITRPYGFMVKPYRFKDVLVTVEIAQYAHDQHRIARKMVEHSLETIVADILTHADDDATKFLRLAQIIQPHVPLDYLLVTDAGRDEVYGYLRTGYDEYQTLGSAEFLAASAIKKEDLIQPHLSKTDTDGFSSVYDGSLFGNLCREDAAIRFVAGRFRMVTCLLLSVSPVGLPRFTLSFLARKAGTYTRIHLELLQKLERTISSAWNAIADKRRFNPTRKVNRTAVFSGAGKAQTKNLEGIIGSSTLLQKALDQMRIVAPMDTTVLILGESGTGKERFAQSIHLLSKRSQKPMTIVNCAALPVHLIESELFGHERGAFTGATERRAGKFEQANGGTLFLDEIGELPLASQAKLLRVLQEKEIERLGGRETIKIDVRIIAATNCDLVNEIALGRFRPDLYYRLHIFPITLPALRDRSDDIPQLAASFVDRFAAGCGKSGMTLSPRAINDLLPYHWPGNVRELEHLLERTVLLNRGMVIEKIAVPVTKENTGTLDPVKIRTIHENEKDYILTVLRKCRGRVSGQGGAAELLGVPVTTLNSKMKRLGIVR